MHFQSQKCPQQAMSFLQGPIQELMHHADPMSRFRFLQTAKEGEIPCSICNRVACATIAPCGDSGFCYPCIFNFKDQNLPCPCCKGPVSRVEFDDEHPIRDLYGVMSIFDYGSPANEDVQTLAEYGEFFEMTGQEMAAHFFAKWA
jgi:hypothetical protein